MWLKKNTSQEFKLKNVEETRNYFIKEIGQNELMSNKPKKVCATLNYIKHFLVLDLAVIGCISASAFVSLLGSPIKSSIKNLCNNCRN